MNNKAIPSSSPIIGWGGVGQSSPCQTAHARKKGNRHALNPASYADGPIRAGCLLAAYATKPERQSTSTTIRQSKSKSAAQCDSLVKTLTQYTSNVIAHGGTGETSSCSSSGNNVDKHRTPQQSVPVDSPSSGDDSFYCPAWFALESEAMAAALLSPSPIAHASGSRLDMRKKSNEDAVFSPPLQQGVRKSSRGSVAIRSDRATSTPVSHGRTVSIRSSARLSSDVNLSTSPYCKRTVTRRTPTTVPRQPLVPSTTSKKTPDSEDSFDAMFCNPDTCNLFDQLASQC